MPTDTVSPAPSSEPAQRLADASLPGTQAELPAYDRSGLSTGIVHLSLIHISEPTRRLRGSRMPSSA